MRLQIGIILIFVCNVSCSRRVPPDLLIGTASSAYQTEGAWNLYGRGESIWDRYVHTRPGAIADNSTGDVASDSYHQYKLDVKLLKRLGFQHYRFSISWSRLLPTGFSNFVNPEGVTFYNNLIDELLANGVIPMVTLFHFDLPQSLQDLGGWANAKVAKWFADYAHVAFRLFGDRVKWWITINEPKQLCRVIFGSIIPVPMINSPGVGEYMCTRNMLMAHAAAYHVYQKFFKKEQQGRVSITIEFAWSEPSTNATRDVEAAERRTQFEFGLYAHPIYTKLGDFPPLVRTLVDKRSKAENFSESRLPVLTRREVKFIQGTYDFFGLNYYTSVYARDKEEAPIGPPSIINDMMVEEYQDPNWLTGSFSYIRSVPWGLRKLLKYIKNNYENPDIFITENGFPDWGELDDCDRITYYKDTLGAALDAMTEDHVPIIAYSAWSLIDNFEWIFGYTARFGLYHVDFTHPNRTRTPKASTKFFKKLIATRILD